MDNRITIDDFKKLLQDQVTIDLTPTEITLHVGDTYEFTGTCTSDSTPMPTHHYDVLDSRIAEFEAWSSSSPTIKIFEDVHSTEGVKITHSRLKAKQIGTTQVLFTVSRDSLNIGAKVCTVNVVPKGDTIC